MNEKVLQISNRICELREILDINAESLAEKIKVPYETYKKYEDGSLDIPISVLYEIASQLGTDLTVLLTGESPRMNTHSVVRADKGINVERFPGYQFSDLALNYIGRKMEPLLVTLGPEDEPAPLVSHTGQEFNFVLKGRVRVTLGGKNIDLNTGDSIYFDPTIPHGQRAIGNIAKFLTVINEEK